MNGTVKKALTGTGLVGSGISLAFLINFAVGYGEVKKDVVHNTEEIVEVKEDVDGVEDKVIDIKLLDVEQTMLIKEIQKMQLQVAEEFKELRRTR